MICELLLQLVIFLGMDENPLPVTSAETRSLTAQLDVSDTFPLSVWGTHMRREHPRAFGSADPYVEWKLGDYLEVCRRLEVVPVSIFPNR